MVTQYVKLPLGTSCYPHGRTNGVPGFRLDLAQLWLLKAFEKWMSGWKISLLAFKINKHLNIMNLKALINNTS